MRNLILVLASLLGLIGFFAIAEAQAAPPSPTTQNQPALGDINCDQKVTAVDALAILRHVAGSVSTDGCWALADTNCDHELDTKDALAILRFAVGKVNTDVCGPGKPNQPLLTLKEGEKTTQRTITTGEGVFQIVLEERPVSTSVVSATWMPRTCSVSIWNLINSNLWRLTLTSTFWYNYQTLTQNPPYISKVAVYPYSWSDIHTWNSNWTYTVKFADGQADLHSNFPIPNISTVTKHLYIQEDAWGNCRVGWYNG